MPKHSKRYNEVRKLVDRNKDYDLNEAIDLAKKVATAKFDETVELHIKTNIDYRKSDQQIRSTIALPHGTGKEVKVLVFATGEKAEEAKAAGADYVGAEDLAEKIQKENFLDFDVAIATPDMMRVIGKLGKILGPRGLMPNPKAGTVTNDVASAVKEFKKGRMEVRTDKTGNLHIPVGKASFDNEKLKENIKSAYEQILNLKPAGVKGNFIKKVVLSTTMGPGIKVDPATLTQ
ncbi:50S ribosomal protein L1 [Thermosipho africanus H17ap60334]|jgi:large subunit ribosomal protein L1|uniref:Large ribosomal subunit protein uL1 n=1 Tax=Thermosipho africanus (strain TCF52B) TaxID=484019 RepID=RL1_THEAB|nr:50S ribosomal protein L1 [Thermosipho africanus]B7IG99.1 RecName: Full=Large ribosomal subunit protein uL1; AltName: Full=50S ribosomal protein L1 [Thermosipho africanus TCF52B]MDK2838671.1 large subunit ribosomal protein [Thermosipho sp. (in: thermotogales)]ACJ75113.1 ribosomal protein L1 [Thermosipho africanus TCF52B]EKF48547.1 50S ribosomal protein L1 [Thermosipho africanus H17ap60334]MDK2900564.1 large subunit ribosomal protein [Thermosipho sp. (in: thermotogales)]